MPPLLRMSLVVLATACTLPGCRYGYELLSGDDLVLGDDDGDAGGGSGLGSGDGDTSGGSGASNGMGGSGASTGDNTSPGTGGILIGSGGSATGSGGDGSGGSGSGGDGSGGSSSGGTGSGGTGTGGTASEIFVTTAVDEDDVGATVGSPGGVGLSFREALKIARAASGQQRITFAPNLDIEFGSNLESFSGEIHIIGNATHLDFNLTPGGPSCLEITGGRVHIQALSISGCPNEAITFISGSNHQVSSTSFLDNAGDVYTDPAAFNVTIGPGNLFENGTEHSVNINSSDATVISNTFKNSGDAPSDAAVLFSGTAHNGDVIGNLMLRPGIGVHVGVGNSGTWIWHNTIATASTGVVTTGASAVDLRNNVLTHCSVAIAGDEPEFLHQDYNLLFNNGAHCNLCVIGANSVIQDPLYKDYAGDFLDLDTGSPGIDAGDPSVGLDRNGGAAGNFNGLGVDIGFKETN